MWEYIVGIDTGFFLWLNSFHNPFWDEFMMIATGKYVWIGLYVSILFSIWKSSGWKTALTVGILCGLAVTIADQASASLIRPLVERQRPSHPDNPISDLVHIVRGYRSGGHGFPSCHAANTCAVATFLSFYFKKIRFIVTIFVWVLINCYSRVYLGVHYPGDLMVGLLIGFFTGLLCYWLLGLIFKNFKRIRDNRIFFQKETNRGTITICDIDMIIAVEIVTLIVIFFRSIYLYTQ